jgi:hypothetical protein
MKTFTGFWWMTGILVLGLVSWTVTIINQGGIMSWKDLIWPPVIIGVATAVYITQQPKKR